MPDQSVSEKNWRSLSNRWNLPKGLIWDDSGFIVSQQFSDDQDITNLPINKLPFEKGLNKNSKEVSENIISLYTIPQKSILELIF